MPSAAATAALIRSSRAFQEALLGWYRANARVLPWRSSPSAYRTVVSEFMLQQTQVKTVLPYFGRWMAELPDFTSLAAASEERVLKLWEGLGYYSRARNLHRLARELAGRSEPPSTAEAWAELPGVGPYTAAAISSIAFGAAAACVDGNVVRILARLTADDSPFADSASAAKTLAPLASRLISSEAPGDHNQAMMELGATVCLRHGPLCLLCPVKTFCAANHHGTAASLPRLAPKATTRISVVRVWCESRGRILLHRAHSKARRLAGLHELPSAEQAGLDPKVVAGGPLLARKARSITRYRITETIHSARPPQGRLPAGLEWVPISKLGKVAFSGPHRRWVDEILAARQKTIQRVH